MGQTLRGGGEQSAMYILIDSGTTTTRVRVTDGQHVLAAASERIGARDTAREGNNRRLRAALRRLLQAAVAEAGVALGNVEAIVASGMITSNAGLLEVPHVPAPAGPADLARYIVTAVFPDISPQPIHFIPGVKTIGTGPDNLPKMDILRGEEAEVTGLRQLLNLNIPVTFLHYGSHHKGIRTDARGSILCSETTMTGELLQAITNGTVLSATVLPLEEIQLDREAWRQGLAIAQEEGFGRAVFLVRVAEQMMGYSRQEASNFLLGALTSLDLPMVERALAEGDHLVLYGNGHFPLILRQHLEERGQGDRVTVVSAEMVELATVMGAVAIYRHKRGRERIDSHQVCTAGRTDGGQSDCHPAWGGTREVARFGGGAAGRRD
ncbi:MAG: 2-dehydro-3-deoxygalactonokinase [Limnochordaceae bacterium]|nr:2-dehydro-3-deoxygalactonokinase [Limnochordaceae bacterium]